MNQHKRMEYLLVTLTVFISAGAICGFLYANAVSMPIEDAEMALMVSQGAIQPFMSEWKIGIIAGYMFSSFTSVLILIARFFSRRRLGFKLMAAALWPVTLWVCMLVGWFGLIPYWIYSLIRIFIHKPQTVQEEEHEN